jgi:hypothetical protein
MALFLMFLRVGGGIGFVGLLGSGFVRGRTDFSATVTGGSPRTGGASTGATTGDGNAIS